MSKIMVWSTKYCMTGGITEHEVDEPEETYNKTTVVIRERFCIATCLHYEGKEWHRTREAAVARAYEMKAAKIASLKRQIEELAKKEWK